MYDSIELERRGRASVPVCTQPFLATAQAMQDRWQARALPVVYVEHPIGPLTRAELRPRAEAVAADVEAALLGRPAEAIRST